MFVNRAGLTFEDVTIPGGFGHLQKGHAIAFADIDSDGDQDVLEQMGAYPGDGYYDAVFENLGRKPRFPFISWARVVTVRQSGPGSRCGSKRMTGRRALFTGRYRRGEVSARILCGYT